METKAHPSTSSVFDYLVWVPAALYGLLFAVGFIAVPANGNVLWVLIVVAILALYASAHAANVRRIRELDAALRTLRDRVR